MKRPDQNGIGIAFEFESTFRINVTEADLL
jgi:hypothetical protein